MTTSNIYAKVGAVFYVFWGLLHLYVAVDQFGFGSQAASADVRARLHQLAAYIGAAGLAAIVIAIVGNWRNLRLAYWLNLGIVSVLDIFYVALVVFPTKMPPLEAWTGPVLWVIATIASTIGFLTAKRGAEPSTTSKYR